MQKYETGKNVRIENSKRETSAKILVTGASGFIGSRLVSRLLSYTSSLSSNENYEIVCLTRDSESLKGRYDNHEDVIKIVEADVNDYPQLVKAMNVTMAFYLIHSMGGSSKEWKKFAQRDRTAEKILLKAPPSVELRELYIWEDSFMGKLKINYLNICVAEKKSEIF